jgi:hypothetical protein
LIFKTSLRERAESLGLCGEQFGVQTKGEMNGKTINDLKAMRESLMKRRTQVALAITDDLDDDVIGKLAMIDAAIVALDKEIALGPRDFKMS